MNADVLLVEDSACDVRLTREAFHDVNPSARLHWVPDGIKAMAFLKREGDYVQVPRPDLVLLDLDLPPMGGDEVLARIKSDVLLKRIPTVILSASEAEEDVRKSYQLQANCFLCKPLHFAAFSDLLQNVNDYWLAGPRLARSG